MKIDPSAIDDLKKICATELGRELNDAQLYEVGHRIIRFLKHTEGILDDPACALTSEHKVR